VLHAYADYFNPSGSARDGYANARTKVKPANEMTWGEVLYPVQGVPDLFTNPDRRVRDLLAQAEAATGTIFPDSVKTFKRRREEELQLLSEAGGDVDSLRPAPRSSRRRSAQNSGSQNSARPQL
jgi:hypothetical protein